MSIFSTIISLFDAFRSTDQGGLVNRPSLGDSTTELVSGAINQSQFSTTYQDADANNTAANTIMLAGGEERAQTDTFRYDLPLPPVEIMNKKYAALESFEGSMRMWSRGDFKVDGRLIDAPGIAIARRRSTDRSHHEVDYMCSLFGRPKVDEQRSQNRLRKRQSFGMSCPFGIHGQLGNDSCWSFEYTVSYHNHPAAREWQALFPKLRKLSNDELTFELQLIIKNQPPQQAIQQILAATGHHYTVQDLINERRSHRFSSLVARAAYFSAAIESSWVKATLSGQLSDGGVILRFRNATKCLSVPAMDRLLQLFQEYHDRDRFKYIQKYGNSETLNKRTYLKPAIDPNDYPPELMALLQPMIGDILFMFWFAFDSNKRTEQSRGYVYGACHQPAVICHLPGLEVQGLHRDSKPAVSDLDKMARLGLRLGPFDTNWVAFVGLTYDNPQFLLLPRDGKPDSDFVSMKINQGDLILISGNVWHAGGAHPGHTANPSYKLVFEIMGRLHGANANSNEQDWWLTYVDATEVEKANARKAILQASTAPYYLETVL